jgi:hypothetical protein
MPLIGYIRARLMAYMLQYLNFLPARVIPPMIFLFTSFVVTFLHSVFDRRWYCSNRSQCDADAQMWHFPPRDRVRTRPEKANSHGLGELVSLSLSFSYKYSTLTGTHFFPFPWLHPSLHRHELRCLQQATVSLHLAFPSLHRQPLHTLLVLINRAAKALPQ